MAKSKVFTWPIATDIAMLIAVLYGTTTAIAEGKAVWAGACIALTLFYAAMIPVHVRMRRNGNI
jgi:hypothetical protein